MTKLQIAFLLLIIGISGKFLFEMERQSPATPPIWDLNLGKQIQTPPVSIEDNVFCLLEGQEIAKINSNSAYSHSVKLPSFPKHPLIRLNTSVVVSDTDGGILAYKVKDLTLLWERLVIEPPSIKPFSLPNGNLLVAVSSGALFALDGQTGNPAWECYVSGSAVDATVDKTIAIIHGYLDLKKESWKLSGIDPDDGETLWTSSFSVALDTPKPYGDFWAFCDSEGCPVFVDQYSGDVVFHGKTPGYKLIDVLKDRILLLAEGGSRLECYSLASGTSWSATLPAPFMFSAAFSENIVIVDGFGIRSLKVSNGNILWEKNLGKTFNAFALGDAICVTSKTDFLSRVSLFSCFLASSGLVYWQTTDQGLFWQPFLLKNGVMVACRTGLLRLFPSKEIKPKSSFADFFQIASFPRSKFLPIKEPLFEEPQRKTR